MDNLSLSLSLSPLSLSLSIYLSIYLSSATKLYSFMYNTLSINRCYSEKQFQFQIVSAFQFETNLFPGGSKRNVNNVFCLYIYYK